MCILSDLHPLLFITFIQHSPKSVPAIPLGSPTDLYSRRFSILPSIFIIPFYPVRTNLRLHLSVSQTALLSLYCSQPLAQRFSTCGPRTSAWWAATKVGN